MAYTPTTWATGDTITAAKLNKLEQGVANGGSGLVVELTSKTGTADHTFAEIFNALKAGIPVYLHYPPDGGDDWEQEYVDSTGVMPVVAAYKYDEAYRVHASHFDNRYLTSSTPSEYVGTPAMYTLSASSPNAYPTFYRTVKLHNGDWNATTDI